MKVGQYEGIHRLPAGSIMVHRATIGLSFMRRQRIEPKEQQLINWYLDMEVSLSSQGSSRYFEDAKAQQLSRMVTELSIPALNSSFAHQQTVIDFNSCALSRDLEISISCFKIVVRLE
jgi:hypothetical protein